MAPLDRVPALLLASALLLVGLTLVPAAAPLASACTGSTHTVETVCGHETPRDYADCYLYENGPLRWTTCL